MSKIQRKPILQSRINQKEFGDVGGISVEKKITELVDFNPTRLVKKGKLAPFVDMAALPTNGKCISEIGEREFTGSGSKFKNGDTLFARITPCLENGKTAKVFGLPEGVAGCGSTEFIVMAAKEPEFDEEYVYYFARLPEFRAFAQARMEGTSGRQRVSWQALTDFSFNFPDKKIRKKVGNILKELDDKIELNRQINQTLEQMAQAIFKSWFVDFDPVRAKMEGRDTGLPAHIADFFPDELEESELGPIPNGWAISTIGNEVEVVGGGTPSTQNADFWDDGEYYWTTPKDLSGLPDKVLLSTERKITKNGLENISSGLLPINTVLMSSRAPVGYLVLAKIPTAINQGFIGMKCNKQLSPEYVLQWANSKMADIKQRASGSTFAEISKKTFRPMGLAIPTKDILAEFTKVAECIYSQIAELVAQSNNLATTRDLLLPKLLSGAIEVKV